MIATPLQTAPREFPLFLRLGPRGGGWGWQSRMRLGLLEALERQSFDEPSSLRSGPTLGRLRLASSSWGPAMGEQDARGACVHCADKVPSP